jgi:hypothetical protein
MYIDRLKGSIILHLQNLHQSSLCGLLARDDLWQWRQLLQLVRRVGKVMPGGAFAAELDFAFLTTPSYSHKTHLIMRIKHLMY